MKAQYCDPSDAHKEIKNQLLQVIDEKIMKVFQEINTNRYAKMEEFYELLHKRKNIGGLQNAFKLKFYRILLEQEIQQFNFMKNLDIYTLKVLKLTKCKLKDFKIDWKQIIGKLESSNKSTSKLTRLHSFLRMLRDYYDENNAMEVFDHFLGRYKLEDETIWIYMEHFINLTKNTKPEIATELLDRLKNIQKYEDVKELLYYRWLLKIKRKVPQVVLQGTYLDDLNHSILNELTLLQSKGKGSIGGSLTSRFLSNIFAKFIGKTNPKSVQMINWLFKIFESGISAFEDKKTALKVLKNFLKPFWSRKTKEDSLRKRLQKKDQEDDEEDNKDKDKQKDKDKEKDKQQKSDLTELLDSLGTLVLEDSEQEQEEEQIDQSLPVEEKQKLREQQLGQLQADELTPEIMSALKSNLQMILEDMFFTPNKDVSNVLKYIYFLFPELAEKSIEYLAKGMDIAEMNFGIHMKNTKKIVQYLLVFGDKERLMENILVILSEISKIRYVKDAWHILSYIIMKIPCLDEDDCKNISQEAKDNFEKNFKIQHDVFYEKYSEMMFQLYKRFIKQVEAKEKKPICIQDNPFVGFAFNVYPEFDKRILELTISNYIDTPNYFIWNYLQLKRIPEKHIDSFLPELKSNMTDQQVQIKFGQTLIACRSLPFDRFSKILHEIAKYESNSRVVILNQVVKAYFQQNIWMSPVYKPIQSSLSYLYDPNAKYEFQMKNNNQQQVEDNLKKIHSLWKQCYDNLLQFIKDHEKTLQQTIDPVQLIKKYYFEVGDPNFELRKQMLWRLDIMGCIIDQLPGYRLVWEDQPILKQLKFKQFPIVKEMRDQSYKLAENIFHIALIEFPHQQKLLSKLSAFSVLLSSNVIQNSQKFIDEYKDICKVIKANESKNHTSYFLVLIKQLQKYLFYTSLDSEFKADHEKKKRMAYLMELQFLHPDQNAEITPFSKQQDYDVTDLLLELLKMTPPPDTQPNRVKLFHQNLSKTLNRLFQRTSFKIPTLTLLQMMALIITHITSSEKSVREGYLSALKSLLQIIEDIKIDETSLEIISQGLINTSSKQKLIWATGLVFLEDNITNFGKFYDLLNQLLFSDEFLIRKYSQFLLSYMILTDQKKHDKIITINDLGEYKQKTLDEFLETGYLRPQHIDTRLKHKKILMRYRSYFSCKVIEQNINNKALSFIFKPEKCLQFLKQYQTDQVSSEDELKLRKKASFTAELSELSDIFTWLKSKYYKLLDISDHQFSVYQTIFGQRFFMYIFEADYHNDFPFFKATKDFVETVCIPNLQTLDNQFVVLNYLSGLLKAYSHHYRTIKSEEVEAFILRIIGEIIQKSSGQFFTLFKKITLIHIDELPFIVNFLGKYSPTHPNFYRTVEIRLIWFSHKRQHLVEMLNDIFKAGKNLQNSNVAKLLKLIVTFNQSHYFDDREINECNIINLKELKEKNDVVQETEHIYTAHRKQFDDILIKNLNNLIHSEKLEDRKAGNDLLNTSISSYSFLQKTQANIKALNVLLNMAVDIVVNSKEQFSAEEDPIESTIVVLLSSVYPEKVFPIILETLKKLLVPLPKVSYYLANFVKYPYNLLRLSEQDYQSFIQKLLSLLQNNLNFKELLTTISSFLYFRKPKQEDVKLCSTPRQLTTYNMALLLSDVRNLNKYERELEKVLSSKEKDKIKSWATMMINSRGKREILEDDEIHRLWRSIKDVSNPYFYHC